MAAAISLARSTDSWAPEVVHSKIIGKLENGLSNAVNLSFCSAVSRRGCMLDWSFRRSMRSSSAILFDSAACFCALAARSLASPAALCANPASLLASAASLLKRDVSACLKSSIDCWTLCSWRLFHQARIPNIDSPATPITTSIPNTRSHTSIRDIKFSSASRRASKFSSGALLILKSADYLIVPVVAFGIVAMGLVSLILPIGALMRILDRRRGKQRQ
jgi:hypothetical protein